MDVFGHGRNFGLQSRWGGGVILRWKVGAGLNLSPPLPFPCPSPPPAAYALGTGSGGFSPEKKFNICDRYRW